MSKRNIGIQISDSDLNVVQGGATVYSDEYNNYGIDLKPLIKTAKWAWSKIKSWF